MQVRCERRGKPEWTGSRSELVQVANSALTRNRQVCGCVQAIVRMGPVRAQMTPRRLRRVTITFVTVGAALVATLATADVTCRPNIFGGQDCSGNGSGSSSRPNISGGYDTTYSNGTKTTSRANIFDGQDTLGPSGTVTSQPNIFGGEDYRLPNGKSVTSQPNIFGGRDYRTRDGKTVSCRPNIFGGEDCR